MSSFLRNFRLPPHVVNEARAQTAQGPQGGEKPLHQRIEALEEQVRLMAKVLDKLVTLHPEAKQQKIADGSWAVTFDPPLIVGPGQTLEIGPESFRFGVDASGQTIKFSLDEFYASREAKMDREELIEQRRRNFPLDQPSSAEPDDDFNW